MQPQKGVYGWYAEHNGERITIYIGKAGDGGTLCRGMNELLRTQLTSNGEKQTFSTLDTNFIVGTAVLYFENDGWFSTWKHVSNEPKDEKKYVASEKPILQNPNARIKDEYKAKKNVKDYWKDRSRRAEAENAILAALGKAVADRLLANAATVSPVHP